MSYGLHIIQYPSGMFGFVGSVPYDLAYTAKDGQPVDAKTIEGQMRLPSNYRTIVGRSWPTFEAALNEAKVKGYEVYKA